MSRRIEIEYPDGTIHNTTVYQVDITLDGRIVISYIDYNENEADSFTEVININGTYYKNPRHGNWNEYEFRERDPYRSAEIMRNLPDRIRIYRPEKEQERYNSQAQRTATVASPPVPPNPPIIPDQIEDKPRKELYAHKYKFPEEQEENHRTYHLAAVLYANGGGSEVRFDRDDLGNNGIAFFEKPILSDHGPTSVIYRRTEINRDAKRDIMNLLRTNHGNTHYAFGLDVSQLDPKKPYRTQNGDEYYIAFSSCDDMAMYQNVLAADSIKVDISTVRETSYPDALSSALHNELPLEINVRGTTITNSISNKYR